jgi:hypothetical protein
MARKIRQQQNHAADIFECDSPGQQKCDFQVEQNEQDGDEVVAHINFMRASSNASKPHS